MSLYLLGPRSQPPPDSGIIGIMLRRCFFLCLLLAASVSIAGAEKKLIQPKEFPTGRPFSPGLLVDDTLYVSGQTGNDLKTGKIPEDFDAEVKQCLHNIGLILAEGRMTFDDVVSVQVYLTDMELFPRMNTVYMAAFKEPRPTRTTVGIAKLVGTARIEITVTARNPALRYAPLRRSQP